MTCTFLAALLCILPVPAVQEIASGPPVGDKLPGAFHPLNVNGVDAGKKSCQVCKNGDNPVAIVFVHGEMTEPLVTLLKRLDAATKIHKASKLGTFAVFCSDDEKLENRLRRAAEKEQLLNTVLTIDNPAGPKGYRIDRDAEITVIIYLQKNVVANHAFRAGGLDANAIDAILKDLAKIVK